MTVACPFGIRSVNSRTAERGLGLPPGRLVDRADAAADCRANERAFLSAEDATQASSSRRRATDDERRLLPPAPRRAFDGDGAARSRRGLRCPRRTRFVVLHRWL